MTDTTPQEKRGITTATQKTREQLTERYLEDYRHYMADFIDWMLTMGKDPQKVKSYSQDTAELSVYKLEKFHQWVWNNETDGYTLDFSHERADNYTYHLAQDDDFKSSYKSSIQKAILREFKFRAQRRGGEPWEPEFRFQDDSGTHTPRDYLSKKERRMFREAAIGFKSIPSRLNMTAEEKKRWTRHLAQRLETPKSEVSEEDFRRADTYKYVSLVSVSLNAGLRPIEVERASTRWVDLSNKVLRIPKEDAAKNVEENWEVALSKRTVPVLRTWLEERRQYEKYEGSDALWLTRYGNPYNKDSLSWLAKEIADEAGIEYSDRSMTWYTLRHSLGTHMQDEQGLAATQQQMRHLDERTTMRYDQAPVDDRRDALDRVG